MNNVFYQYAYVPSCDYHEIKPAARRWVGLKEAEAFLNFQKENLPDWSHRLYKISEERVV